MPQFSGEWETDMTTTTIGTDNATGDTIVTITWSTGECIRYTVVDSGYFAAVWHTGYGCPDDGIEFSTWECGAFGLDAVGTFDTVAEAIDCACAAHCVMNDSVRRCIREI